VVIEIFWTSLGLVQIDSISARGHICGEWSEAYGKFLSGGLVRMTLEDWEALGLRSKAAGE
jgi:hypothetical protein